MVLYEKFRERSGIGWYDNPDRNGRYLVIRRLGKYQGPAHLVVSAERAAYAPMLFQRYELVQTFDVEDGEVVSHNEDPATRDK